MMLTNRRIGNVVVPGFSTSHGMIHRIDRSKSVVVMTI
jgi:hypothetical protein